VKVTLGVDLVRYRPGAAARGDVLAWSGAGGIWGEALASAVAKRVGLRLWSPGEGAAAERLPHARALLHPVADSQPAEALWPLRALACAVPVIAVAGSGLDAVFDDELCGRLLAAPAADQEGAYVEALKALPLPSEAVLQARRRRALGHHNRRAMVARCRELYAAMREAR
jgi:glycosyltransferase involved in cell wall biosynthesis